MKNIYLYYFTDRVAKILVGVRQNTRIMSYILVSIHQHLPGPGRDIERSSSRPCVQTASLRPGKC